MRRSPEEALRYLLEKAEAHPLYSTVVTRDIMCGDFSSAVKAPDAETAEWSEVAAVCRLSLGLAEPADGPKPEPGIAHNPEPYISIITWTNSGKRAVSDGGQTRDEANRIAATFKTPEFRTVKVFCRHHNWGVEWKRAEGNHWTEVGSAIGAGLPKA